MGPSPTKIWVKIRWSDPRVASFFFCGWSLGVVGGSGGGFSHPPLDGSWSLGTYLWRRLFGMTCRLTRWLWKKFLGSVGNLQHVICNAWRRLGC